MARKKGWRFVAVNLLLVAASTLLSVAIVEYGLRLYLYRSLATPQFWDHADVVIPHETRGWALKPESFGYVTKRDYKTSVRVNEHGLRDDPHPYEKPDDTFRIVLLGDSFMEAQQVPMKAALPYLIETLAPGRKVEVINAGVNGYSTAQQLIFLREEGVRYQPDLVLLSFYVMNDVVENSRWLNTTAVGDGHYLTYGRPYAKDEGPLEFSQPDFQRMMDSYDAEKTKRAEARESAKWYERTALHRYYEDWDHKRTYESGMAQHLSNFWYGVCLDAFDLTCVENAPYTSADLSEQFVRGWAITERLVAEMKQVSESAGARFAAFIVPGKFQIEEDFRKALEAHACGPFKLDVWKPNRRFTDIAKRLDFPVFDLGDVLTDTHSQSAAPLYFGWDDDHWTALGHRVAAEALVQWLDESELIRPQP